MPVDFDYDQQDWGSSEVYPDNPSFDPRYVVIHWGGSTSAIIGVDAEMDRLRRWQNYHINGRGWRDIAYNFAVGDSGAIYRLRGYNPGGHTSSVKDRTPEGDSYNAASLGVVWIGGAKAGAPTREALESMAHLIATSGISQVKSHQQVKQENNSHTACPGEYWIEWVNGEGWMAVPNLDKVSEWAKPAWIKAYEYGLISEFTLPQDDVSKEELFVFLDRAGWLDKE